MILISGCVIKFMNSDKSTVVVLNPPFYSARNYGLAAFGTQSEASSAKPCCPTPLAA